jgi:hypothetical protein
MMNLVEIRKNGVGNGFAVINPQDGYRKDNTVWNGTCSECGERVYSSLMSAKNVGWVHTQITGRMQVAIGYCPKVGE